MSLLLTALAAVLPTQDDAFRYVVPPAGDPMRRPTLVALPLGTDVPEGLRVARELEGRSLRLGFVRFGDESSTRVIVALEELDEGGHTLYADVNRDLVLDADERIREAAERAWEFSLPCSTVDDTGAPTLVPRRVAVELGKTGTILGIATLGWLEGRVAIGDDVVAVRRRDANANGFFHDAEDHFWLDRDGDGAWSPMEELYVVQPILPFDGERYALRSSRLGDGLQFERIDGSALARVALPDGRGAERTDVVDARLLLVGRDGSAYLVRAPGTATEVPVGDYRTTMVTLRLADPGGHDPWSYVFSERYEATEERWRALSKDQELTLDPIGALDFDIAQIGDFDEIHTGERLRAQLRLHTGDRLLVTTCYRGKNPSSFGYGSLRAKLKLVGANGRRLGETTSGFA